MLGKEDRLMIGDLAIVLSKTIDCNQPLSCGAYTALLAASYCLQDHCDSYGFPIFKYRAAVRLEMQKCDDLAVIVSIGRASTTEPTSENAAESPTIRTT